MANTGSLGTATHFVPTPPAGSFTAFLDEEVAREKSIFDELEHHRCNVASSCEMLVASIAFDSSNAVIWSRNQYALSKHLRLKISRAWDALDEIEVSLIPGEIIREAKLCMSDMHSGTFTAVKVIHNVNGPFRFFDSPLAICVFPFSCFSLAIEIDGTNIEPDTPSFRRRVDITQGFVPLDIRGKFCDAARLYGEDGNYLVPLPRGDYVFPEQRNLGPRRLPFPLGRDKEPRFEKCPKCGAVAKRIVVCDNSCGSQTCEVCHTDFHPPTYDGSTTTWTEGHSPKCGVDEDGEDEV